MEPSTTTGAVRSGVIRAATIDASRPADNGAGAPARQPWPDGSDDVAALDDVALRPPAGLRVPPDSPAPASSP